MTADEVKASAESGKSYKIKVTLGDATNFTNNKTTATNITGSDDTIIDLTAANVTKSGSSKVTLELIYGDSGVTTNDKPVPSSEDKTV